MQFEEPIPVCIDGEIKGAKNIDFTVVKNAFNFVLPKGCDFKYKSE
jgi:diacylglycerol kinase family enzyme